MHSIETRPEREEGIGKERQSDRQAERKNRLKPTKKTKKNNATVRLKYIELHVLHPE